jgi:4-diphosphocytidyl-2C-methyl-D-erythritol kinase
MHATIRQYHGAGTEELFDALEQREPEVRELISTVPGFVSYTAFRSGDGGMTVTVCQDKAGTDESTRRAAAWVAENIHVSIGAPSVVEGDTSLQF